MTTPVDTVGRLNTLFENTGIPLLNIQQVSAFLKSEDRAEPFETWSVYFQRLFRYHDFCALELDDVVAEGGKAVVHLMVEKKLHEALSGAYRLVGSAVDAANPEKKQPPAHPQVQKDEVDAVCACLLTLYWAFASESERKSLNEDHFADLELSLDDPEKLMAASPEEVLAPDGEIAMALEDLAVQKQLESSWFGRPVYPPVHPAVEYHTIASDEQSNFFKKLNID